MAADDPDTHIKVIPEQSDTIESLMQRMLTATGGRPFSMWEAEDPKNPTDVEKNFLLALEWMLAKARFQEARMSMMRKGLDNRANDIRLASFYRQATRGDEKSSRPATTKLDREMEAAHEDLAGMPHADAMKCFAVEVERQKIYYRVETILPAEELAAEGEGHFFDCMCGTL